MIFMREVMASFSLRGGDMMRLQHAVNTETYAEFFFVRLNVNVAGAPLHGVGQHQIHQLDDGSFVRRFLQIGQSSSSWSACSSTSASPSPSSTA